MKHFPNQQKSPAQPHEMVRLYLDIGQCRFLHKLIQNEYQRISDNGIPDINNAVLQLLEHFEGDAYPKTSKPFHFDEGLDKYIDSNDKQALNELLAFSYVGGSFSHG